MGSTKAFGMIQKLFLGGNPHLLEVKKMFFVMVSTVEKKKTK